MKISDIEMTAVYNGYKIERLDFTRQFALFMDGVEIKRGFTTLDEVKKWVDKQNKKKFKRVAVIFKHYSRGKCIFVSGEATSMIDGTHVWITCGIMRCKLPLRDVLVDSEANRDIINEVNKVEARITGLEKEIVSLTSSAQRLTEDIMIIND